jgi:hypothetical protein
VQIVSDEMSEEKPTFKVTDRRLFNADGTPREGIAREEPDATPNASDNATTQAKTANAQAQSADARATTRSVTREQTDRAPFSSASDAPARDERGVEGRRGEQAQRGASSSEAEVDPTPFANLVMFIASPAAAALGMTEHPSMPPGEVDLPLAKHCIDLLLIVRDKTRGNLSAQEQQILESLLAELQMQYVSLTKTHRPPPPRGFSGSDITGGR